jgi:4a-hydroxytetrahydrobiopterin dehydratase
MALLSQEEIDNRLSNELSAWVRDGDAISRSVEAPSFLGGIDLVRKVAEKAESADHHPDIDIRYTSITFRLSTHSEGGVTQKDVDLAFDIDQLVR